MSEFELLIKDFNYIYMTSEQAITQYIVIAISLALFNFTKNKIRLAVSSSTNKKWQTATNTLHRILTLLIFISISSVIISYFYPTELLDFIEILLIALIFSRLGVHALRYIFAGNPFLKSFENLISLLVWAYTVIYLFGFSGFISSNLESIHFNIAGTEYNFLLVIQLIFAIIFAIVLAMSLVAFVERRLMNVKSLDRNLRAMINKVIKLIIYILA